MDLLKKNIEVKRTYLAIGLMLIMLFLYFSFNDDFIQSYPFRREKFSILLFVAVFYYPSYILMLILPRLLLLCQEFLDMKIEHGNKQRFHFTVCKRDLWNGIQGKLCLIHVLILAAVLVLNGTKEVWEISIAFCYPILLAIVIITCLDEIDGYDMLEVNNAFRGIPSIGQAWANAQISHFKKVLKDLPERIEKFEKKNDITIKLRKMMIIMPLSCDVQITFDKIDANITYVGDLNIVNDDQGANINRIYKNPVYKIGKNNDNPFYLVMESCSTAFALRKIKEVYKNEIWEYQRSQFISHIKEKLKDCPCEIFIYDDTKRGQILLSTFLQKELNPLIENVYCGP